LITAVDTSVLLDVYLADPEHGQASATALRQAMADGALVACEAVWAEICAAFPQDQGAQALRTLGIGFDPLDEGASIRAGDLWRAYRAAGGTRSRVAADFLIGAHAGARADRLLTRDHGFFRGYFLDLELVVPGPL